ncbi:3 -5 exonuclease helicase [Venturia nashicola]|uniref:3-5 exonuclease helicase n=1 Tax=Venturia nashicola TaxID=86259 RepID=A0A4Z1PEA1_9PEZI|nr:3 -5 exonuclease helicase [Venturia nashicola]
MSSQKRKREDVDAGDTFHMIESRPYYPTNKDGIVYWTYKLFRGPAGQEVRVTYCRTLQECETAVRRIANSAALGFDLEWKTGDGPNIKDMVSVIQLASESDIVIIHIAAFPGGREATRQQLLSPALKRILEDGSIIKVGLRISGDGNRMREQLGVFMEGVVEVAKLRTEESSLTNPSLSDMTKTFLGMPLDKSLSTSTWHYERVLREDEIEYAGTDAYAGLKLYQHFIEDHDPSALDFLDFRALQKKKEGKQSDPSSLFEKLKKLRLQLTAEPKSKIIDVGSNAVLKAITNYLPTTLSALSRVPDFRSNTLPEYKKAIVELVQDHVKACPQDEITTDIDSSPNSSQEVYEIQGAPNCLAGLTFVITGVLPMLSRDDVQNLIKEFGGKVTTSTSRKTDYVVLGENAGRTKCKTIEKLGLETVNEEELLHMIRTRLPPAENNENDSSRAKQKARKDSKAGGYPTAPSPLPSLQETLFSSQDPPLSSQDSLSSSQQSTYSSHFSSPAQTIDTPSQPFISFQNDIISISSSQDSDDNSSQDSITSSTTNIYNTLYFLRQKLSQSLHLSNEEIATDDLLGNLAEVRPLSNGALENLGAGGFAEMAMEVEGVDVLAVIREG